MSDNTLFAIFIIGGVMFCALMMVGAIFDDGNKHSIAIECIKAGGEWKDNPHIIGVNMQCVREGVK